MPNEYSTDSFALNTSDEVGDKPGFGALTAAGLDLSPQTVSPQSGKTYDSVISMIRQEPMMRLTTQAVREVLNEIGLSGRCIQSNVGGGENGAEIYGEKHDLCGVNGRASGSVNFRASAHSGAIYLESLTVSADGVASISFIVHALTNSAGDDPFTIVENVALPSTGYSIVRDQMYGLWKTKIVTVETEDIQRVTFNFGVSVEKPPTANGTIYPNRMRLRKVRPSVRLFTTDLDLIDGSPLSRTGTPVTHADSEIRLVKLEPDGDYLDTTDSEHIKIGLSGMAYITSPYGTSGDAVAGTEIVVQGRQTSAGAVPFLFTLNTNLT